MKPKILFKTRSQDCDNWQFVTRYLNAVHKIDIVPLSIIDRDIPETINGIVPTLITHDNIMLRGLDRMVKHYEHLLGIDNLIEKATYFINLNPNYRVGNMSYRIVLDKAFV